MYLFVYGTLKRGFRNHHYLGKAKYYGMGLLPFARMLSVGSYPAVIFDYRAERPEGWPVGEIFEINEEILSAIDHLEGYYKKAPHDSLYVRQSRDIWRSCEGGGFVPDLVTNCFVYIWNRDISNLKEIKDGVWQQK
jgi:gamma-glutamylcyclotransferase (GGCT)/AIG2-like uncharacterized protein YtfP